MSDLNKSIDILIDQFFTEQEDISVNKSIDIAGDSKTKADEVVNQAPSYQDDASRSAGRPKQISDVPKNDMDGARAKEYDSAISEQAKEEDQEEADQVKEMNQVKEGGRAPASKAPDMKPFKKSLTEEEYAEYMSLKKAQESKQQEDLRKAQLKEQEDLIKSVVEKTAQKYESRLESMQKALDESSALVKAMASAPQRSKSVTNIESLEKSIDGEDTPTQETYSRSEVLDAAEELYKSGQIKMEHVIEAENNGYIYDKSAREKVERYLSKR